MECAFTRKAGWVRIGSRVVQYTTSHPLFSERYGFKFPIIRVTIGTWTFAILYWRD